MLQNWSYFEGWSREVEALPLKAAAKAKKIIRKETLQGLKKTGDSEVRTDTRTEEVMTTFLLVLTKKAKIIMIFLKWVVVYHYTVPNQSSLSIVAFKFVLNLFPI